MFFVLRTACALDQGQVSQARLGRDKVLVKESQLFEINIERRNIEKSCKLILKLN